MPVITGAIFITMNTFIIFRFHTDDVDFMVMLLLLAANYKSIKVKSIEHHDIMMIHQISCTSQVLQPLMNCNGNNQINFLVPGVAFGIALAEIVIPVNSLTRGFEGSPLSL